VSLKNNDREAITSLSVLQISTGFITVFLLLEFYLAPTSLLMKCFKGYVW